MTNVPFLISLLGMFVAGLLFSVLFPRTRLAPFVKECFEKAMSEPEVNSRLVFLLHGLATAFGIFILSVGFLFAKDRSSFVAMVTAVGGGGVGAALGRMFTKIGDGKQGEGK